MTSPSAADATAATTGHGADPASAPAPARERPPDAGAPAVPVASEEEAPKGADTLKGERPVSASPTTLSDPNNTTNPTRDAAPKPSQRDATPVDPEKSTNTSIKQSGTPVAATASGSSRAADASDDTRAQKDHPASPNDSKNAAAPTATATPPPPPAPPDQPQPQVKKREAEGASMDAVTALAPAAELYDHSMSWDEGPGPWTPAGPGHNPHGMFGYSVYMPSTVNFGPSTVTPSQVHLSSRSTIYPGALDGAEPSNNGTSDGPRDQCLESFAQIEFADGVFQMTTYSVIIGRDTRAIRQVQRDEKRAEMYQRKVEEHERNGLPPPPPLGRDRLRFSKSYVSEEGGMLGPESNSDDESQPPAKRRKTSSAESSVGGQENQEDRRISNRQYVSHTPGAAAVDLSSLRPSPNHVAFVGIHSPGPDMAKKSKGISREHLRIDYNKDKGVFQAKAIHDNGFFHQENHQGPGSVIVLRSGDRLQIKDVDFRFIINGVTRGFTGAEDSSQPRKSKGGKEMSFDFEQAHGNGQVQDTSDELSDVDEDEVDNVDISLLKQRSKVAETDEPEDHAMEDAPEPEKAGGEGEVLAAQSQLTLESGLSIPTIPKKRGPGRPPKNGVMSKRQQRELRKMEQELERQKAAQAPPTDPPAKRKVGRPRKHPLPEGDAAAAEKRKYKPRKPKTEDGAEGSDAEKRAKEKKGKMPRAKSPPLQLRREDYTEEQLQKPNKNYGILIDETLSAAPEGLTLKQIYKRIAQSYPWFYFHTETKGWESSVRHNLIGNEAFKKEEATNVWKRVPGVELDAGKRRKATSPPAPQSYSAHAYPYNQGQHLAHGAYPPGHQMPQGFPMANYNPHQPGQVPVPQPAQQHVGPSASPPNLGATVAPAQPPVTAQQQSSYMQHPPPSPAQPGASSAYNSPYSHPPPPQTNPSSVKVEDGGVVGTRPPTQETVQPVPTAAGPTSAPGASASPLATPQQSHQQMHGQPNAATAAPSVGPTEQFIEPALLSRLQQLRTSLANGLKRANTPHAEDIVWSALDRIVGLKKDPAGLNDGLEATCFNGMESLISRTAAQLRSNSCSTLLPPDVTKHIEGLRNQCVDAIKKKLPQGDAVSIVHSAIVRALGLANESRIAGRPESMVNLERAIMRNVGDVLKQMLGAGREASRGSSAGPGPSPSASQPGTSAAPLASTPATQQTPAATPPQLQPASVPQTSAASAPQAGPSATPQVSAITTQAPVASKTEPSATPIASGAAATSQAPGPAAPQGTVTSTSATEATQSQTAPAQPTG